METFTVNSLLTLCKFKFIKSLIFSENPAIFK